MKLAKPLAVEYIVCYKTHLQCRECKQIHMGLEELGGWLGRWAVLPQCNQMAMQKLVSGACIRSRADTDVFLCVHECERANERIQRAGFTPD